MDNLLALFDLIGMLARRRYQIGERYFSAIGLNHTEARLLTLLQQEDGTATQEALSNMLFLDRSNAGRAIKSLEQQRYIERSKHDADRRTNLVHITARGREAVAQVATLKPKMARDLFGDLTDDEADQILGLLGNTQKGQGDA
jgi:MarR family transcriptional regulator, transcriptional regulator for hemolysin